MNQQDAAVISLKSRFVLTVLISSNKNPDYLSLSGIDIGEIYLNIYIRPIFSQLLPVYLLLALICGPRGYNSYVN